MAAHRAAQTGGTAQPVFEVSNTLRGGAHGGVVTNAIANCSRYMRDVYRNYHTSPNEYSWKTPKQVQLRQHPAEPWTCFVPRIQRLAVSPPGPCIHSNDILDDGVDGWPYGCAFGRGRNSERCSNATGGENGGEEENETEEDDEGGPGQAAEADEGCVGGGAHDQFDLNYSRVRIWSCAQEMKSTDDTNGVADAVAVVEEIQLESCCQREPRHDTLLK